PEVEENHLSLQIGDCQWRSVKPSSETRELWCRFSRERLSEHTLIIREPPAIISSPNQVGDPARHGWRRTTWNVMLGCNLFYLGITGSVYSVLVLVFFGPNQLVQPCRD